LLDVFFQSDMAWIAHQNHSLQTFFDTINILRMQSRALTQKQLTPKQRVKEQASAETI